MEHAGDVNADHPSLHVMLSEILRYVLFLSFILAMVNIRHDYEVFQRNHSLHVRLFENQIYETVFLFVCMTRMSNVSILKILGLLPYSVIAFQAFVMNFKNASIHKLI